MALAPTLQLSPASDLIDGQVIQVTGSGYSAGAPVFLLQCGGAPTPLQLDDCETFGAPTEYFSDSNGEVSQGIEVGSLLHTRSGVIDCRTATCVLAVYL